MIDALTKGQAVARMYALGGAKSEPLGPGSKEKKSSFEALARFVFLDVTQTATKSAKVKAIASQIGIEVSPEWFSSGDTVTLLGINRLIQEAIDWRQLRFPVDQDILEHVESLPALPLLNPNPRKRVPTLSSEQSEVETLIAEAIVELSKYQMRPTGFEVSPPLDSVDEVNFEDGTWRERLLEQQSWLDLPESLQASTPERFDESLSRGLGLMPPAGVQTEILLPALAQRIEFAVTFANNFATRLEEEAEGSETIETATNAWLEEWRELLDEQAAESGGPINAIAGTWPIQEFVSYASESRLNLNPSYQRADVWPTGSSQLLIESVVRGIPLPSVILLQDEDDNGTSVLEVVDGKQRLTSVLRFVGAHPSAIKLVSEKEEQWGESNLLSIFQKDYLKFRSLWRKHEQESLSANKEKELYFPFKMRTGVKAFTGDLAAIEGKYFCEIINVKVEVPGERIAIGDLFRKQCNYRIPVIIYKSATGEQVHEVFTLYNKQGKHLNAEEIRNARYHRVPLMLALLALAGDAEDAHEVAPFLSADWDDLGSTREALEELGFQRAGYKRTKLLAWVASILFSSGERIVTKSTATQINELLEMVERNKPHPLNTLSVLTDAMKLLDAAVDVHASLGDELWADKFRNAQGKGKWQELQLVAVLTVFAAASVKFDKDSLIELVEERFAEVHAASAIWARPGKTQTKQQWMFVAEVVRELLIVLGLDAQELGELLKSKFSTTALLELVAIEKDDEQ